MTVTPRAPDRRAGVLLPLFSIRSRHSWGVGEFPDIDELTAFLAESGQTILQLLPLGATAAAETSPYSALTAFGLDLTYLAMDQVDELSGLSRESILGDEGARQLEAVRACPKVDYATVRRLKRQALTVAYERYRDGVQGRGGTREGQLAAFREEQRSWLPDYALFRALRDEHRGAAWTTWPEALRDRHPEALAAARERLADAVGFHEYVQWQCDTQLRAARSAAARHGVLLKGDLPFMVSGDSADAWAHQDELRRDVRLGAPPDQFAPDGQDWGLPVHNWEVMEQSDLAWIRQRAARAATLYDLFRLDHVVGFYRQFIIPPGQQGSLVPEDEGQQVALGERILGAMLEAAAAELGSRPLQTLPIVAEDLGVVPPFVRHSLTSLGIPGTKVLRWERDWEGAGGDVFLDPATYAPLSLCTSGTHDTTTLATWYEELTDTERRALFGIPAMRPAAASANTQLTEEAHEALLGTLYGAGSILCILPMQDLLGSRDRINVPSTVSPDNWVYRLPATVGELRRDPNLSRQLDRVRRLCLEARRIPPAP